MHGAGFGMGAGGFGLGWIFMILFWVLVIVAIVYIVKYFIDRGRSATVEGDRAEEILRKRFASGEISREEFNEKMKVLKG
jgi:putative membrane protein